MNPEETITLRTREQGRLEALTRVRAGEWSQVEAAHALGISTRQVRRLVQAYQARGLVAVVHGEVSRLGPSATRTPERGRATRGAGTS